MNLPPLPESTWHPQSWERAFSADQMRAYAAEAVRVALEQAAQVCESEPERQRGDGVWAADQKACADAIRALKEQA